MSDTPSGVKALLYDEAALKESLENVALDIFSLYGCARITTPAIEYWAQHTRGLDGAARKRVITFADPSGGGEPLALRSDVTPQIARIAATTLKERPLPLRLSYAETVYRSVAPGLGHRMEVYQAGAELIGQADPSADAEMIAMAAETLLSLGIPREKINISISHSGYIRAALDALQLDDETSSKLQNALALKAQSEVSTILDMVGASGLERDALLAVTSLFGEVALIDKAARFNDAAAAALDNLSAVTAALTDRGYGDVIGIDLGEVRGFCYYTGVTFEGFVGGMPRRAFSGGRYDNLLAQYGASKPATGFAIDIDHLLDYLRSAHLDWRVADLLLISNDPRKADQLRSVGISVASELIDRPLHESIAAALSHKLSWVAVADGTDGIQLIDPATGESETINENDLVNFLTAQNEEEENAD